MEEGQKEHMNLVFAGHVDHGKSTLIGRLLYETGSLSEERVEEIRQTCKALGRGFEFAYVMDHLEEERAQNVTIDTAQTFFSTKKRNYVIIDAPGHLEFMKNMVTGASQAEAAILIIDVNEGVREQTKRHAYVLKLLGINRVIVVLNKMDLVGYSRRGFIGVENEIGSLLKNMGITPTFCIPVSAKEGENIIRNNKMRWFKGPTLLEALDSLSKDEEVSEVLALPVQLVFGGKVMGRVESGVIRKGDKVLALPEKRELLVKGVKCFGGEKYRAVKGDSVGLVLDSAVNRGDVISNTSGGLNVASKFRASVFWMGSPLKDHDVRGGRKSKLILRLSTQELGCAGIIEKVIDPSSLKKLSGNVLGKNEVGELIINTEKPIVIEKFVKMPEIGRFVLERDGEGTVAAGIVTGIGD